MLLLTNDDGIQSPTLRGLAERLADQCVVVAPDGNRSACSSSLTVRNTIQTTAVELAVPAWEVSGTPADCVQLALDQLVPENNIERVISGINLGANLGDDVLYSGTVAAAMEGRVLGRTAIALSVNSFTPRYLQDCLDMAVQVITELSALQTEATVYNVNMPDLPAAEVPGWKWTRQGQRGRFGKVRQTGAGEYQLGEVGNAPNPAAEGTDFAAIQQGYISVTPLLWQNTAFDLLAALSE